MARKISLREFQQGVAERLRDLSTRRAFASKLGFQVGAENYLVNLADVSEVIPLPVFVPVPQTREWFRGVANIRGKLYSVVDFSAFQGGNQIVASTERRVILLNERIIEGSALMVSRMLGLRNPENFRREENVDPARPWRAAMFVDDSGARWIDLDVVALAKHTNYLEVGTLSATAAPS